MSPGERNDSLTNVYVCGAGILEQWNDRPPMASPLAFVDVVEVERLKYRVADLEQQVLDQLTDEMVLRAELAAVTKERDELKVRLDLIHRVNAKEAMPANATVTYEPGPRQAMPVCQCGSGNVPTCTGETGTGCDECCSHDGAGSEQCEPIDQPPAPPAFDVEKAVEGLLNDVWEATEARGIIFGDLDQHWREVTNDPIAVEARETTQQLLERCWADMKLLRQQAELANAERDACIEDYERRLEALAERADKAELAAGRLREAVTKEWDRTHSSIVDGLENQAENEGYPVHGWAKSVLPHLQSALSDTAAPAYDELVRLRGERKWALYAKLRVQGISNEASELVIQFNNLAGNVSPDWLERAERVLGVWSGKI